MKLTVELTDALVDGVNTKLAEFNAGRALEKKPPMTIEEWAQDVVQQVAQQFTDMVIAARKAAVWKAYNDSAGVDRAAVDAILKLPG